MSSNGLGFLLGGSGNNGRNIGGTVRAPGGTDTGCLAGTATYEGTSGTFTATPVLLPATLPMLLCGMGGLVAMARRGKPLPTSIGRRPLPLR